MSARGNKRNDTGASATASEQKDDQKKGSSRKEGDRP